MVGTYPKEAISLAIKALPEKHQLSVETMPLPSGLVEVKITFQIDPNEWVAALGVVKDEILRGILDI
jgi:hypothetical protein